MAAGSAGAAKGLMLSSAEIPMAPVCAVAASGVVQASATPDAAQAKAAIARNPRFMVQLVMIPPRLARPHRRLRGHFDGIVPSGFTHSKRKEDAVAHRVLASQAMVVFGSDKKRAAPCGAGGP
ncbi:MAG: hypothetical protein WC729_00710 [Sphingomonas sp.]|jgi:hypothetical protein|uniref:hypothetical protein n=1 Tax=Sphingomonas sp. TaxID=28214 RepID=UPI003568C069